MTYSFLFILSETVAIPASATLVETSGTSSISTRPSPQEPITQTITQANQPVAQGPHPSSDRVSNLELENKLLRQEVGSLNEELVSVVQRAKVAERGK